MAAGSVSRPSRTHDPSRRACVPYDRGCGLPRLMAPEVASALASDPTSTQGAPVISHTSFSLIDVIRMRGSPRSARRKSQTPSSGSTERRRAISPSRRPAPPQLSMPESFRWAICTWTPVVSATAMASRTASAPRLASSRTCEEYAAPWRRSTRASATISSESAWQPGARGEEPRREPPRPRGQRLLEEPLHRGQFLARDRPTLHSGGHEPEGVVADLEDHVHGGRRERRDVLRERRRGELEPGRARRQVLPVHRDPLGHRRRDREAAVAHDLERDALADLRLRARIERQREVRVRVDVDEPGRHDLTARVDGAVGRPRRARLDRDDASGGDAHVGVAARRAGAVDHVATPNQQVIYDFSSHARSPRPATCATTPALTYGHLVVAVSGGRTSIRSSIS